MKKVIFSDKEAKTINLNFISDDEPIFAKRNNRLAGMIIKEDKGWILRLGGEIGYSGYHSTRYDCLKSANDFYEFFVEE